MFNADATREYHYMRSRELPAAQNAGSKILENQRTLSTLLRTMSNNRSGRSFVSMSHRSAILFSTALLFFVVGSGGAAPPEPAEFRTAAWYMSLEVSPKDSTNGLLLDHNLLRSTSPMVTEMARASYAARDLILEGRRLAGERQEKQALALLKGFVGLLRVDSATTYAERDGHVERHTDRTVAREGYRELASAILNGLQSSASGDPLGPRVAIASGVIRKVWFDRVVPRCGEIYSSSPALGRPPVSASVVWNPKSKSHDIVVESTYDRPLTDLLIDLTLRSVEPTLETNLVRTCRSNGLPVYADRSRDSYFILVLAPSEKRTLARSIFSNDAQTAGSWRAAFSVWSREGVSTGNKLSLAAANARSVRATLTTVDDLKAASMLSAFRAVHGADAPKFVKIGNKLRRVAEERVELERLLEAGATWVARLPKTTDVGFAQFRFGPCERIFSPQGSEASRRTSGSSGERDKSKPLVRISDNQNSAEAAYYALGIGYDAEIDAAVVFTLPNSFAPAETHKMPNSPVREIVCRAGENASRVWKFYLDEEGNPAVATSDDMKVTMLRSSSGARTPDMEDVLQDVEDDDEFAAGACGRQPPKKKGSRKEEEEDDTQNPGKNDKQMEGQYAPDRKSPSNSFAEEDGETVPYKENFRNTEERQLPDGWSRPNHDSGCLIVCRGKGDPRLQKVHDGFSDGDAPMVRLPDCTIAGDFVYEFDMIARRDGKSMIDTMFSGPEGKMTLSMVVGQGGYQFTLPQGDPAATFSLAGRRSQTVRLERKGDEYTVRVGGKVACRQTAKKWKTFDQIQLSVRGSETMIFRIALSPLKKKGTTKESESREGEAVPRKSKLSGGRVDDQR